MDTSEEERHNNHEANAEQLDQEQVVQQMQVSSYLQQCRCEVNHDRQAAVFRLWGAESLNMSTKTLADFPS